MAWEVQGTGARRGDWGTPHRKSLAAKEAILLSGRLTAFARSARFFSVKRPPYRFMLTLTAAINAVTTDADAGDICTKESSV